jgi:hypothetical protein
MKLLFGGGKGLVVLFLPKPHRQFLRNEYSWVQRKIYSLLLEHFLLPVFCNGALPDASFVWCEFEDQRVRCFV